MPAPLILAVLVLPFAYGLWLVLMWIEATES
jgi:hypothetical protein